jgi:hypothetical protein
MINRVGLDDMMETSEGFYITMQVLRSEVMGGFSLTKNKLQYVDVTISMLNDIAKYSLLFDDEDNAWQLAVAAYKIGVAYNKEDGALSSFRMLYKVSSSSHDRFKPALEKIAEHALKAFVKKGWNTNQVTPILNEVQGQIPPISKMATGKPVSIDKIPKELKGWMDVLTLEKIKKDEYLLVRSEGLHARVAIKTTHHPELRALKTGHKVALTRGEFEIIDADAKMIKDFATVLVIEPSQIAEISYEGEYGFTCMKVAKPETEA